MKDCYGCSVDKLPLACRFQETVENRFTKLCGVQYLAGFFFFFIANCLNGLHVCKSGHKLCIAQNYSHAGIVFLVDLN